MTEMRLLTFNPRPLP